jgi:MFS family permease
MPAPNAPPSGHAGRALALLLAINLFNYLDRYSLAAVEPLIAKQFFSAADATAMAKTGSLATAFLVSYMILAPVFGWLADRFSRWLLIAAGVAIWSLASAWSGLAGTFATLVVTRVFVGIGEAAYGPAAPTIISDHFAVAQRGRMLAFFYVAIPVGSAIGSAFGGVIGQRYGWRWPFYLVALPGLLLAALCLCMRDPRGPRSRAEQNKPKVKLHDIFALFRIRSYLLNTAAMTAMTFAIGGISFWLPRYLFEYREKDFGDAPNLGQINLIFGAITVAAGLIATLLGGWVADRVQRRLASAYFLVSGIAILFSFPAIIAMLRVPFPWAWALIFVGVFFLFFNTGPSNAALANVTPPAVRATAFALNIFIIHAFGDAISPPLIGWIAGRWNMDAAFVVMAAVILLASIFWIWGARYLGRDTSLAEGHPDRPGEA